MANVVAADYESVKASIAKMDSLLDDMNSTINDLLHAINNTRSWVGVDAAAYKTALVGYAGKMRSSSLWLKSFNNVLSRHAYALYRRAVEDSNATRW